MTSLLEAVRLVLRKGPAAGELLCEMAPFGPLYSRKPTPQPQAPGKFIACS